MGRCEVRWGGEMGRCEVRWGRTVSSDREVRWGDVR